MKTSELLKLLKRSNCHRIRSGSRHDIWYSTVTGREFPVPRHKAEIPTGTLLHILKDAGIS